MFLQLAHTKTEVFIESKKLALECYKVTQPFPAEEKFGMISQIRRAALSVHLNIAEGCSRKSIGERRRYYEISRGSVVEIDTAIDLTFELKYCNMNSLQNLGLLIISNFKQLTGLINGHSNS